MLIEFSVKNFRCFKEKQTISFVASNNSDFSFNTKVRNVSKLLPSIGLFGANASGKSTLVTAMDFFIFMVVNSSKFDVSSKIRRTPFQLNRECYNSPSEFEIVFVEKGTIYQYGFSLDEERIISEWMYMIPEGGRTNVLFERYFDNKRNDYDWNINDKIIKGPKSGWKKSTKENSLFFSTAVNLNAEIFEEPYYWFNHKFRIIKEEEEISNDYTARRILEEKGFKEKVLKFFKDIGQRVDDIEVFEREVPQDMLKQYPEFWRPNVEAQFKYSIKFVYDKNENLGWGINDESGGTNKIFSLLGPLTDVMDEGFVFVIDELHNHLHPYLLEFIIKMFQNKNINKNNAQLLFTSHDIFSMDPSILGREQIWLVEKNQKRLFSTLYPIANFKDRKETLFWQAYRAGKYGAIPNIREFDF